MLDKQALSDDQILSHYIKCAELFSEMFNPFMETVVHDLRGDNPHIIAIFGGQITGRKVDMPTTDLGKKRINMDGTDNAIPDKLVNYTNMSPSGNKLKSSSLSIRNNNGALIGSFCINMEISYMSEVQRFFDSFTKCSPMEVIGTSEEFFPKSVEEELESTIKDFLFEKRWQNHSLSTEQKIQVVKHLKQQGLFSRKLAVENIAKLLNVTKPSVYNYLKKASE